MNPNQSNISGHNHEGTPIKGNPAEFFGLGIIAFLDLLGFSSSILSQWGFGNESPLAKLLRIKDIPLVRKGTGVSIGLCTNEQLVKVIYSGLYQVKVHTLSDSVTLSVALPSELTLGDFALAFFCIAANIRYVVDAALNEGYVVRGAAEIGQIFWNDRELIGPALIKAYSLERCSAKTSRVILGPDLLISLVSLCEKDAHDWTSLLRKNEDGLISFDTRIRTRTVEIAKLRDAVKGDKEKEFKYRDLVDSQGREVSSPVPTIQELRLAASQLKAVTP